MDTPATLTRREVWGHVRDRGACHTAQWASRRFCIVLSTRNKEGFVIMAVNINRDVKDVFFRYKMPRLIAKVRGRGQAKALAHARAC